MSQQAVLTFNGSYTLATPAFPPSSAQQVLSPFSQTNYLAYWSANSLDLTVNTAVALPMGNVAAANFIYICAVGGKVMVRITSADGTTQSIPVDPLLILYCASVPVTAIDITRVVGTPTTITYLIAQNQ